MPGYPIPTAGQSRHGRVCQLACAAGVRGRPDELGASILGLLSMPLVACVAMSAQPVHEPDPDDPVEILRVLPERFHEQFLAEYYQAASEAARQVDGYRQLHDLLRLWRLSAAAYSAAGFEERLQAVQEAVRTGSLEGSVPIEEIVPGWPDRL
jgi:hypothetical protein